MRTDIESDVYRTEADAPEKEIWMYYVTVHGTFYGLGGDSCTLESDWVHLKYAFMKWQEGSRDVILRFNDVKYYGCSSRAEMEKACET